MITSETCYEGITADGKMILTPAFKRSIAAFYQSRGEPIPSICREPGHARAMDSAPDDLPDNPDRAARYKAMEDAYAALLHKPCGQYDAPLTNLDIQAHARDTQIRGERDLGRPSVEDQAAAVARHRRVKCMDGAAKLSRNDWLEIELELRRQFWPAMLLIICWCLPSLHAQQPTMPVALFSGGATLGTPCQFAPANSGVPSGYLSPSGTIETCAIVPGRTLGFWQIANQPFQISLPQAAAVAMNGSDQVLYSANLPPLPAGACYVLAWATGALSDATVELKIDGTIVNTPFTAGTVSSLSVSNDHYCNQLPSQSTQFFGANNTNSAAWTYWTQTNTPAASVDWSVGHAISITANQANGSITPISFSIAEVL